MVFNPEDEQDFGPHCRNCHKGSSRCSTCHNTTTTGKYSSLLSTTANNSTDKTNYHMSKLSTEVVASSPSTTTGTSNPIGYSNFSVSDATGVGFFKKSRTANWDNDWRTTETAITALMVAAFCADDGFSWPHRTLGWKMLKDDLFGLDFNNNTWIGVGEERFDGTTSYTAHDLDSVCLDCHNPNIWNSGQAASGDGHVDAPPTLNFDDHDDELLTRGLP